jgi:hypothetical protein
LNNITFCHSEPAFFAGEESAVGRTKADSSRDKTALGMTKFSNWATTGLWDLYQGAAWPWANAGTRAATW